jgi:hypothetical protein
MQKGFPDQSSTAVASTLRLPARKESEVIKFLVTVYENTKRGAETWGFHESPSYPHMYCFLAWRERMESRTEKILRWNTNVIGDFLSLGSVSYECHQYEFLRDHNVTKGWRDFFQRESHQRVLRESRCFT